MKLHYRFWNLLVAMALVFSAVVVQPARPVLAAPASLSTPYSQNFDTLNASSLGVTWLNETTVPGWYSNRPTYNAGNGSSTTGALYSFGSTGSGERALGSIASGTTTTIYYGVLLANDTGLPVTQLNISYTGEQWRNGGAGVQHTLNVSYQVGENPNALNVGPWTEVPELNFTSPVTTGTTGVALDGNNPTNKTAISAALPVTIAPDQRIMLRWMDIDNTGGDHGLAIDDLSITAVTGEPPSGPTVSAVAPEDADVPLDTNLSVYFDQEVDVTDDWLVLTCGAHTYKPSDLTASVTPDSPAAVFTFDPATNLPSATQCSATIFAAQVTATADSLPMESNYTWTFTTHDATSECGTPATEIAAIQGSGVTSPLVGQSVWVEGVVTADFQPAGMIGGYFIQDSTPDSDPLTSDGVYVYDNANTDASVGDVVRISGTVTEYAAAKITELGSITSFQICASEQSVDPIAISLPIPPDADETSYLERYEGMLVTFPQELTVEQNYFQGRYGQITLGAGRVFQPNNFANPGGADLHLEPWRSLIVLDDGFSKQNPNPIPYLDSAGSLRAGDTVTGVTGILDQGSINSTPGTELPYNYYRIQPVSEPVLHPLGRPLTPPAVPGDVRVATMNVYNFFTTLNDRGANSATELTRQTDKLAAALVELDADVLGLVEIESKDSANATQALVDAMNALAGAGTYAIAADPQNTASFTWPDVIQQSIIYQPARVTPAGDYLVGTDPVFSRSPLAQTFEVPSLGARFSLVVNHFKSKGSCPAAGSDLPNQDAGQGCWNAKRVEQADALLAFIETVKTQANDPDVLVMGDLNAYGLEDPIVTLEAGGLQDQVARYVDPASRYSYVFDGTAGYLDHALASVSLAAQVAGTGIWHINADEPSVIDYNTEFKPVDLYTADAFRSADHDPIIVGLALESSFPVLSGTLPNLLALEQVKDFTVSVANPVDGASYPQARFNLRIVGAAPADLTLSYWDGSAYVPLPLAADGSDAVAYFGPQAGFLMPAGYTATTNLRVQPHTAGSYGLMVELVNLKPDGQDVLDTLTSKVDVVDLPAVSVQMPDGFTVGESGDFSWQVLNPASGTGYTSVSYKVSLPSAEAGDITLLQYQDGDGWHDLDLSPLTGGGLYGVIYPEGSALPSPFDQTFPMKVTFANYGTYPLTVTVQDLSAEPLAVPLASAEGTAYAWTRPVVADQSFHLDENQPAGAVVGTVAASDLDGDTVTFSLSGSSLFSIDADSGQITAAAPFNYETVSGPYSLTITVTDEHSLSDSAVVTVTIDDVNESPVVAHALSDQTATTGQAFSFVVPADTFSDPDGDSLVYSAFEQDQENLPSWLSFDPDTRTFSGTPGAGDVGTLVIVVRAEDAGGLSDTDAFQLTVQSNQRYVFLPFIRR